MWDKFSSIPTFLPLRTNLYTFLSLRSALYLAIQRLSLQLLTTCTCCMTSRVDLLMSTPVRPEAAKAVFDAVRLIKATRVCIEAVQICTRRLVEPTRVRIEAAQICTRILIKATHACIEAAQIYTSSCTCCRCYL